MSRSLSRTLYLIGIGILILGGILLAIGIPGGTTTTDANGVHVTTPGNGALFGIGLTLMLLASIPMFVAWIGALVRTAQLGTWGWFVALLLVSGIAMLIYIFFGPDIPRRTAPIWSNTPSAPGHPPNPTW
jgi:hypothetical protein